MMLEFRNNQNENFEEMIPYTITIILTARAMLLATARNMTRISEK